MDRQVHAIAKHRRMSDNRVLVELVEQGIQSAREKERAFRDVAERLRAASNPAEVKDLGERLGRSIFGESCHRLRAGRDSLRRFATT